MMCMASKGWKQGLRWFPGPEAQKSGNSGSSSRRTRYGYAVWLV